MRRRSSYDCIVTNSIYWNKWNKCAYILWVFVYINKDYYILNPNENQHHFESLHEYLTYDMLSTLLVIIASEDDKSMNENVIVSKYFIM